MFLTKRKKKSSAFLPFPLCEWPCRGSRSLGMAGDQHRRLTLTSVTQTSAQDTCADAPAPAGRKLGTFLSLLFQGVPECPLPTLCPVSSSSPMHPPPPGPLCVPGLDQPPPQRALGIRLQSLFLLIAMLICQT